jgi:hypothetical protein
LADAPVWLTCKKKRTRFDRSQTPDARGRGEKEAITKYTSKQKTEAILLDY